MKDKIKQLYKQLEDNNLKFISILCIFLSIYILILIIDRVRPRTYNEKIMHCLELENNTGMLGCVKLTKEGIDKI